MFSEPLVQAGPIVCGDLEGLRSHGAVWADARSSHGMQGETRAAITVHLCRRWYLGLERQRTGDVQMCRYAGHWWRSVICGEAPDYC